MKVFCNKKSKKTSKDLSTDFFLEIRALASLEDMFPGSIALQFFLDFYGKRIENRREKKIEINNYHYDSTPCYDAHFYTFNLLISKTSLNLI